MGSDQFDGGDFDGAKVALFLGDQLAVILRDDDPAIPFPGFWDLPGGGREGRETPKDCVIRECEEELNITIPVDAFCWQKSFEGPNGPTWFFIAKLPAIVAGQVVLGDEGQRWALMHSAEFVNHPGAIPHLQSRLRMALGG